MFYKETDFKQTSGRVFPEDWDVLQFGEVISDVKNGFASGKRDENGIVQIRMNNVTTNGQLLLDSYLKVPMPDNIDTWLLRTGDFLFNNTNSIELVGKSTIFKEQTFPCTFSNHFTRLRFKDDSVVPEWVLYHFLTLRKNGYFRSVAIRHVGQAAVHTEYLLKLRIPKPKLTEQKKIVEVLSCVDLAIEKTGEVIAKTERLKKGLMQKLLTEGIGHKEFKDTEIGRIPTTWSLNKLGDLAERITKGTTPTTLGFNYVKSGVRFVKVENIDNYGNLTGDFLHISKEANDALKRSILQEDDILLSIVGFYLGRVAVVRKEILPANTSQNIAIIRLKNRNSHILPQFAKFYLMGSIIQDYIRMIGIQSAQPSLNLAHINDFLVSVPPLDEQKKIVGVLSVVDEKLKLQIREKAVFGTIKLGLMDLLLTGKVRVKVD